jgi:type III secretion system chaperone SycN
MSWVEGTVADFGRGMGIDGFAFNAHGVASLVSETLGSLFLERLHGAVLVYLVRPLDRPSGEALERALDACHWRHNRPYLATPGLRHDVDLLFAVRLAEGEFDLPTLERVISLLDQLHREVREGVPA